MWWPLFDVFTPFHVCTYKHIWNVQGRVRNCAQTFISRCVCMFCVCVCVCMLLGDCPQGSSPHQKRQAADQLSPSQLAAWCPLCLFLLSFSPSSPFTPQTPRFFYPSYFPLFHSHRTLFSDFYCPVINRPNLTFPLNPMSRCARCIIGLFCPFVVPLRFDSPSPPAA